MGSRAEPGRFYTLASALIERVHPADFERLLAQESPVARAMGLYGLVRTQGAASAPYLERHLSDRTRFWHQPHGCTRSIATVGQFARYLLRDRNHLESSEGWAPIVGIRELCLADLGILAEDRAATMHREVAHDLNLAIQEGYLGLSWDTLEAAGNELSPLETIKAVGRLPSSEPRTQFLAAVLRDDQAAPTVRLAAASGLSRTGDDDPLRTASPWLDSQIGRARTARLLDAYGRYRAWREAWEELGRVASAAASTARFPTLEAAAVTDQPLGLATLLGFDALSEVERYAAMREAWTQSLIRIADGLAGHGATWDTFRNAPFLLEPLVVPVWGSASPAAAALLGEARPALAERLAPYLGRP